MGTHPIFESDFDCLTGMDRLLYSSLSSTGRKLVSTRVQSDLKQKSVEEKIQLFPLGISSNSAQIKYSVIPISPGENDILMQYKKWNNRSVFMLGSFMTATSGLAYRFFWKNSASTFKLPKGGFVTKGPLFVAAFCLIGFFGNQIRQQLIKRELLPNLIESAVNDDSSEEFQILRFKYPKKAMTRDDFYDKTFDLEAQIHYFNENEDELEKRIMLMLESDSLFFSNTSEIYMEALSWKEIEEDQNISFIS